MHGESARLFVWSSRFRARRAGSYSHPARLAASRRSDAPSLVAAKWRTPTSSRSTPRPSRPCAPSAVRQCRSPAAADLAGSAPTDARRASQTGRQIDVACPSSKTSSGCASTANAPSNRSDATSDTAQTRGACNARMPHGGRPASRCVKPSKQRPASSAAPPSRHTSPTPGGVPNPAGVARPAATPAAAAARLTPVVRHTPTARCSSATAGSARSATCRSTGPADGSTRTAPPSTTSSRCRAAVRTPGRTSSPLTGGATATRERESQDPDLGTVPG